GLALHNYHSSFQSFPPGSDPNGFSVHAQLLPYLEQDPIYKTMNFNVSVFAPPNQPAVGMPVAIFICPSDPGPSFPAGWAGNNYVANEGTDPAFFSNNNGVFFMTGFFSGNKHGIRVTDIKDGSSNTAAFCERLRGDFDQGTLTPASDLIMDPQDY